MRYVHLPKTELNLSQICMGTLPCGSRFDQETSNAMLDRFADQGGNFFDTASIYCNWIPGIELHSSEKTVGRWLRTRPDREKMIIATKGGCPDAGTTVLTMSPEELNEQIEDSRAGLQLDTIPLYYLHRDDPEQTIEQIMDNLFMHQDKGHLRYLACSNWTAERIRQANAYAKRCGRLGFVTVSNRWSLAKRIPNVGDPTIVDMDDALYRMHAETGLAASPFTSTASGYLSKLMQGGEMRPYLTQSYGLAENEEILRRALSLAEQKNASVQQIALAWLCAQEFSTLPVTAFSSIEQLDEAAAASDIVLTPEERDWLRKD